MSQVKALFFHPASLSIGGIGHSRAGRDRGAWRRGWKRVAPDPDVSQSAASPYLPCAAGEGDHRPKSRWWRGQPSNSADRTAVGDSVRAARPLHHSLFSERSPSPTGAGPSHMALGGSKDAVGVLIEPQRAQRTRRSLRPLRKTSAISAVESGGSAAPIQSKLICDTLPMSGGGKTRRASFRMPPALKPMVDCGEERSRASANDRSGGLIIATNAGPACQGRAAAGLRPVLETPGPAGKLNCRTKLR